ncbi:dense granule protein GRA11 [Toxoplasma gondii COUG]|uniref:Dense granule protein GRA11 n=1 Tax=Toxoplasma gondii COUG TaxID=1074873 RepID=A0A2G8XLW7_TOXGO|nr:dense granule protein GRA11 [Toxoplasma gondii COUG]
MPLPEAPEDFDQAPMPLPQAPEELEQAPASHPEEAEQEVPERKTEAGSEPEKDPETNLLEEEDELKP